MHRTLLAALFALAPGLSHAQSGIARGTEPPQAETPGIGRAPDASPGIGRAPGAPPAIATPGNAPLPRPRAAGEICDSVEAERICVSSVLPASANADYGPANLVDGTAQTGWVEGVQGPGAGEFVTVEFIAPTTITRLRLLNGYGKSTRLWQRNGRIVSLAISASNGRRMTAALLDQADWQTIGLDGFDGITWLALTIERAKPGTAYADTVLSEIELY